MKFTREQFSRYLREQAEMLNDIAEADIAEEHTAVLAINLQPFISWINGDFELED